MDTQISRRTLTSGALWAVPTAAVVGTVPAFAASNPPTATEIECGVTTRELTEGTATSHQLARMFKWKESTTTSLEFGKLQNAGLITNFGWMPSATCGSLLSINDTTGENKANIITYKTQNATGESYLPPATITDANGNLVATGKRTSLGNVASGGYYAGVSGSMTTEFPEINTRASNPDPKSWDDLAYPLTVKLPVEVSYTATAGALKDKLVKRIINVTYTIETAERGVVQLSSPATFSGGWTFPDPIKQPKVYIAD